MRRFLETFFRYWLVVLGIIVLCIGVSGVIVYEQPRTYRAATSLWFQTTSLANDSAVGGAPTVGNTTLTPADDAVGFVQELLKTRKFCVDIATKGPLGAALAARTPPPAGTTPELQSQLLDDAIQSTLGSKTSVAAGGPELVTITFDDSDPQVAAGTLKALLDELSGQTVTLALAQAERQVTFYSQQLPDVQRQSDQADAAVSAYLIDHPELKVPNPPPDGSLAALEAVANQAHQRLGTLLQNIGQAKAVQQGVGTSGQSAYRVIDAPDVPHASVSRLKPALLGLGAGFSVAVAFSLLALVLLTRMDTSVRSAEDVDVPLGLRTIASVPFVPASRRGRTRRAKRRLAKLSPADNPT